MVPEFNGNFQDNIRLVFKTISGEKIFVQSKINVVIYMGKICGQHLYCVMFFFNHHRKFVVNMSRSIDIIKLLVINL